MEACYGGTDVMERSCAVARGIDINNRSVSPSEFSASRFSRKIPTWKHLFTEPPSIAVVCDGHPLAKGAAPAWV